VSRGVSLDVIDVTVRFGARTVLDRVSLHVASGDVVAVLGPSGSGKSTLLRVIAGLEPPAEGAVLLGGTDVTQWPTHRRGVGMVFQDEQLFPHLDVAANIAFGLPRGRRDRREVARRVGELLDLVGLEGFEHRHVADLSGGEGKRVALARALAPQPRLLLLDEPLTGLDVDLHDRLALELASLLRGSEITAVLVTHDPAEAATVADRVLHLHSLSSPNG